MSVLETVLIYVVPPLVVYAAISVLVYGRRAVKRPRYRAGEPWNFEPRFWTANPEGAHLALHGGDAHEEHTGEAGKALARTGGARGHW